MRQKKKRWIAPHHIKYYYGRGLVKPCPWKLPEQTVSSETHYVLWKASEGNMKVYNALNGEYKCPTKK